MNPRAPFAPLRGASSARPRRPRKPRPLPSSQPHRCVVLGVDPGQKAGWSIWCGDKLIGYGEVKGTDYEAVIAVVRKALQLAALLSLPCVLAAELPPVHHKKRSFKSMLGSGETRAAWRMAWEAVATKKHRVTLPVRTWRQATMPGWESHVKREHVKAAELRFAADLVKRFYQGALPPSELGAESAPAILIGRCGTRAGEVAAVLPQSARAA